MASILLIDDDEDTTCLLKSELEANGHRVQCLEGAEQGPQLLARGDIDVLLLDNQMPGMSGIEFLADLRRRGLSVPVILMTGHGSPDTAIRARKLGARAYFLKPVDGQLFSQLEPLIEEMVQASRLMKERVHLPGQAAATPASGTSLLGNSPAMQRVYERIGQVAESNAPVLILGETGTGKELIARAIFQYSERSDKPFVAVNCAAIPETLLESELFGHEKGAFSGADRRRIGKFEQADGGTILLDEIGDMTLATQAKILRVLQEGELTRLGSNEVLKVDVRVTACTHRDLEAAMAQGGFRSDLFYRLNVVTISLPPLRHRGAEDLFLLAQHFVQQEARDKGRAGLTLHPRALEKLAEYPWPGNIRELKSVLKLAVLICSGAQIMAADIEVRSATPASPHANPPPQGEREPDSSAEPDEHAALAGLRAAIRWALRSGRSDLWPLLRDLLERELLQLARAECTGQSQLADRLGIGRTTLWKRLKELGLELPPHDPG